MDAVTPRSRFVAVLVLMVASALSAAGQSNESIVTDLHARGSAGFTLDRSSTGFFTTQGVGEEITTDVQGAIINPNFINFSNSLSVGHTSQNINANSLGADNMLAGSAGVFLLPASSYPFAFTWQRTRVDLGQTGLSTTTNDDRMGFDWRLQRADIPKLAVRYDRDSNYSDVPVGTFGSLNSHSSGVNVAASDTWKGWDWTAGWLRSDSVTQQVLLDTQVDVNQEYSIVGGTLKKSYWDNKGLFNYGISRDATDSSYGSLASSNGVLTSQSANTSLHWTPKLTTYGMFQYYTYDSHGQYINTSDPSQPTIVAFPLSGYAGNGTVLYQFNQHISVSNSTGYSSSTPGTSNIEQLESFFTNYPAINVNFNWHRIRFNTSYGLGYTHMHTNFGNTFDAWSNNGGVGASWANPWVTLSGNFGVNHGTNQILAGSYTDNFRYGFAAESTRFRKLGTLRFRWQMLDQDILGSTGYVQSTSSGWNASLIRRRWQIDAGSTHGTGAQQLFGQIANPFQPLPPLVGVPILNDNIHSYYILASARLRENLQIHGTYRKDVNDIVATGGSADYSLFEIYADYRVGKMVMEASYGHYLSVSNLVGSSWGAGADRIRLRIVRTFNWF